MPTPGPPYPAAFRQQMVELVRAGRGVSELAREFGRNASSIHAWVKSDGGLDGAGTTSVAVPLSSSATFSTRSTQGAQDRSAAR